LTGKAEEVLILRNVPNALAFASNDALDAQETPARKIAGIKKENALRH